MKFYFILANLIILSFIIHAQSVGETRPSVNAQQFISAASSDIGLHTGQVSVNIPLFTLQGKGLNIPISLAFNGGDITHESEASHIGLGWSLLAGGVITATIRGLDDRKATSRKDVEWQYTDRYLEDLRDKQSVTNGFNECDNTLSRVIRSGDSEPDSYNYSFLGYSGIISYRFDNNNILRGKLYPDQEFKIAATSKGYKITADDGIEYYFEQEETSQVNGDVKSTSWFLSEIKTIQGGHAIFNYADETMSDLRTEESYKFNGYSYGYTYPVINSKRLTRIDYNYGHVDFKSDWRGDIPGAEKITKIELYNSNGVLVKGYEMVNNGYFDNKNPTSVDWHNIRLKLDGIKEYNRAGEYQPPYAFEYDYKLNRSKASYKYVQSSGYNSARNSWAWNPAPIAVVDRGIYGAPACWLEGGDTPYAQIYGFGLHYDDFDETVEDYFCLKTITFPTGGNESYTYNAHDYLHVSESNDAVTPNSNIIGRRISQKIITDNNGNRQIVEYMYCLHDGNYQITDPTYPVSSGILINPTIHTSVMYKPVNDIASSGLHDRLEATPYTTDKPQNTFLGSPICYTEVEETFRSGNGAILGKKIYYFDKVVIEPARNYMYVNYEDDGSYRNRANLLVPIKNTLYGKQRGYPSNIYQYNENNYTYMAYPVGQFAVYDAVKGKVRKEVTLDFQGRIVRKIENEYNTVTSPSLYGLTGQYFDDTKGEYPSFTANRYLISVTTHNYCYSFLEKSTTTNYFIDPKTSVSDSTTEIQTFGARGKRLFPLSRNLSNGQSEEHTYFFPDQVFFNTKSNLSNQASALKRMVDKNMIINPIQTTKTIGGKHVEGSYTTYKLLPDSAIVVDTLFSLDSRLETSILDPFVNATGKVVRHGNFSAEKEYLEYDVNANPVTIKSRSGIPVTYKWGYGGQYPIAKIENYTRSQLESKSTLLTQLNLLGGYTVITDANRAGFVNCNQAIRNSLPANVMITTYTYDPLIGMTSITDLRGVTTYYNFDNFNRFQNIKDNNNKLLNEYQYHYYNQP